jgi:hypothetical protein
MQVSDETNIEHGANAQNQGKRPSKPRAAKRVERLNRQDQERNGQSDVDGEKSLNENGIGPRGRQDREDAYVNGQEHANVEAMMAPRNPIEPGHRTGFGNLSRIIPTCDTLVCREPASIISDAAAWTFHIHG